jgi:type I restriction enzyme S subunit
MPNNWKTYKLGEVTTLQRGFDLPNTKRITGKYPVIAASGFSSWHNQYKVKGPGVITGRSGTLGKVFYEANDFWPLNTSLWVKDFHNNNPKFIYYFLKTLNFEEYNSGTSVPTLNRNDVHKLDVQIPSLKEQKAIAQILSAIDDKIENNLATNKTLEDMAMVLYKHWFVDFGPFQEAEFIDSELGLIPEGWVVRGMVDLFAIKPINGLYKKKEFQGSGSRWLKMKSVYGIDIITNEKMELINVNEKEIEKYGCKKNDIVFGRTSLVLEGIGTCAIIKSNTNIAVFESNLFRFRFDENLVLPDLMFLYFKSTLGREEVKKLARQTAAVSITSSDVSKIKIALPNKEKQMELGSQIERFIENIVSNKEENQTLTKLRDTLLPKLISGEIRLKEFREVVETIL